MRYISVIIYWLIIYLFEAGLVFTSDGVIVGVAWSRNQTHRAIRSSENQKNIASANDSSED